MITEIIALEAKLLNTDWLRQRAFFPQHEVTFGNQEGMITGCWLAERACIKLVSSIIFEYGAAKEWDDLPKERRTCATLKIFEIETFRLLIESDNKALHKCSI